MYSKVFKDSAASTKAWVTINSVSSGGKMSAGGGGLESGGGGKVSISVSAGSRSSGISAGGSKGKPKETSFQGMSQKTDTNHIGSVAASLGIV